MAVLELAQKRGVKLTLETTRGKLISVVVSSESDGVESQSVVVCWTITCKVFADGSRKTGALAKYMCS